MEIITNAIIAALANLAEPAIKDAYNGLKSLISRKFGKDSKVVNAVEEAENNPKSEGRKVVLKEELAAAKADEDDEIIKSAKELLEKIKAQPGGQQIVNQVVTGNQNIFSGTGDVNVTKG